MYVNAYICQMTYENLHLKNWFSTKTALNLSQLEKDAGITKDCIRHFIKERRTLSEENLKKLKLEISKYGFVDFNEE